MKLVIICLTFLLINCTLMKSQTDHLEPLDGIFSIYNFEFEYSIKVRNILFEGLSDSPEIRFLILPSFSPENVLDVHYSKKHNKYFMVYHICDTMIWDNKDLKSIKVLEYKKEISKKSVDLIKSLFKNAVLKTKYSDDKTIRLDGVVYYFSYNEMGIKSGKIWSPKVGSKMDRLVEIGLELIELSKNNDKNVEFNNALVDKIQRLVYDLQ